MHENQFQAKLQKEILERFPGSLVIKLDTRQGLPDLLILYKGLWAALECKASEKAIHQPNQDYYVALMDEMEYARFIFPENREEVLDELVQVFGV